MQNDTGSQSLFSWARAKSFGSDLLQAGLIALAYYLGARIGLLTVAQPEGVATIWPPSGIFLAALVLLPRRKWPLNLVVVGLTNMVANLAAGNPPLVSLGFAAANCAESGLAAWLLLRFTGGRPDFRRLRDVAGLTLVAGVGSNAVTALLGASVTHFGVGAPFWPAWLVWWVADGIGMVLTTPFILLWVDTLRGERAGGDSHVGEAVAFLAGFALAAELIFGSWTLGWRLPLRPYLILPLLTFAALRYRPRGLVTCLVALGFIVLGNVAADEGPFTTDGATLTDHVLSAQLFLAVSSASLMFVSALILERRQALEGLRQSEAQYRDLLQIMPVGVILHQAGQVALANRASARIFGAERPEQLAGTPLMSLVHPDFREQVRSRVGRTIEHGEQARLAQERLLRLDGAAFDAEVTAMPVAFGGRAATLAVLNDITERKQAEDALRESERRMRETLENIQLLAVTLDARGCITFCNDCLLESTGWRREEVMGADWFDRFVPQAPQVREIFDQALAQEAIPPHYENEILTRAGGRRLVRWNNIMLRDLQGQVTGAVSIGEDITERKQAEDALRASEQALKRSQAVAHVGHWTWDTQVNTVVWSDEMYRIFGLDRETFTGDLDEVIRQAIHPEDRERVRASNQAVLTEQRPAPMEYRVIWPDGSVRHLWAQPAGRETDAAGNILRLSGIVQDITERKLEAEELEKAYAHREATLNALPDLMFEVDRGGAIYDFRAPRPELLYAPPQTFLGKTMGEVLPPDAAQVIREALTQAVEDGTSFGAVYSLALPAGLAWFELSVAAMGDPQSPAAHFIMLARDITARKQAEEALQASQALLNTTGRMAKVGGWEIDLESQALNWTDEVYRIHEVEAGFRPTVAAAIDFYAPESRPVIEQAVQRAIEQGESFDVELQIITARGNHRWVHAIGQAHARDGKPAKVAGAFQDITERKQAEAERERLLAEVERKNKELESIIYIASHDLRSPLVNIQGFGRNLAKHFGQVLDILGRSDSLEALRSAAQPLLEDRIPVALRFIETSSTKMDTLISGLLRVSRIGRAILQPVQVDMQGLFQNILDSMAFQIERAQARVDVEQPLAGCRADPAQFSQVLSNLLDNALKYRAADRPLVIRLSSRVEAQTVVYTLADTGVGIAPQHQEKIWEIFRRLDDEAGILGEGLGLTIARRIVERHGGRIWVESAPGTGSRFIIEMPR